MCPTSRNNTLGFWRQIATSDGPSLLEEAFTVLDGDGDGEIRSSDLFSFFSLCLGQPLALEEAEAMIAMADLDGNGAVDLQEFKSLMTEGISATPATTDEPESRAMKEIFQVLDMNQDGFLSADDLKSAMDLAGEPVSSKELDAMISAAAGSRKVPIDFDCFFRLMTGLHR